MKIIRIVIIYNFSSTIYNSKWFKLFSCKRFCQNKCHRWGTIMHSPRHYIRESRITLNYSMKLWKIINKIMIPDNVLFLQKMFIVSYFSQVWHNFYSERSESEGRARWAREWGWEKEKNGKKKGTTTRRNHNFCTFLFLLQKFPEKRYSNF